MTIKLFLNIMTVPAFEYSMKILLWKLLPYLFQKYNHWTRYILALIHSLTVHVNNHWILVQALAHAPVLKYKMP